jgi:hypothetical protein
MATKKGTTRKPGISIRRGKGLLTVRTTKATACLGPLTGGGQLPPPP